MKKKSLIALLVAVLALAIPIVYFQTNGEERQNDPVISTPAARILSPSNSGQYVLGDVIKVEIEVSRPEGISNLKLEVNDQPFGNELKAVSQTIDIQTQGSVGKWSIRLSYDLDGKVHADNRTVDVFSDVKPVQKKVKIVNRLPHNHESYTQGLEFYNGKLYEGTGQWGLSKLMEVNMNSGEAVIGYGLGQGIFGEGITLLNDTIYQLTYQSGLCYMYDLQMNRIGEFRYTGEGWGLCNDGTNLLMTNGSDMVYWRDPRTFEVVKTMSVFDHEQSYVNLNELELIDGHLFANIYTQNYIIEIDTSNGKVLSVIDCQELVSEKPIGSDYLNGIAHNPETGKTYMTGKLWAKLYEVTFE